MSKTVNDWSKVNNEIVPLLGLATPALGFRLISKKADLEMIPEIQRIDQGRRTFCQVVTKARVQGITIGVTADDLMPVCAAVIGLRDIPPGDHMEFYARLWCKTEEDARKRFTAMPKIPCKGQEAVVLAPLSAQRFEPEVILIYGNPTQMSLAITALQWEDYGRFQFSCTGEGACVDSVAQCYNSGKPALAIPCWGERRTGGVRGEELALGLPPQALEKMIRGLKAFYDKGIKYPPQLRGIDVDPVIAFKAIYGGTWAIPED